MRLIINAPPADFEFAVMAAKWMIKHPENDSAVVAYGRWQEGDQTNFYVRRTKSGLSVRRI